MDKVRTYKNMHIQLVTWTYTHLHRYIYNICSLSNDIFHSSPLLTLVKVRRMYMTCLVKYQYLLIK